MKLENQVCNLEYAIRIKEFGIRKESLFAYYGNAGNWHDTIVEMAYYKDADQEFIECKLLPAYTVAELGEMLTGFDFPYFNFGTGWQIKQIEHYHRPKNEADARAMLLIYLIKNKLYSFN